MRYVVNDVHVLGGGVDGDAAPSGGDNGPYAELLDRFDDGGAVVGGVVAEAHAAEPDVEGWPPASRKATSSGVGRHVSWSGRNQ